MNDILGSDFGWGISHSESEFNPKLAIQNLRSMSKLVVAEKPED